MKCPPARYRMLCGVLTWVLLSASAGAHTRTATPADYLAVLHSLEPGDELRLAGGSYPHGLPVHGLLGTAAAPIVIRGPEAGDPARFLAREGHNTISIRDSAYVEIAQFTVDGRGMPVDAVKCEGDAGPSDHITLAALTIVGHGVDRQIVGISTKCPAAGWIIRDNVIVGAGTGIYLGDSDGSAPFVGGRITENLVVDSLGYDLQIKHQISRPPTALDEPAHTLIARNVFAKIAAPAPAEPPRPNVLLGHWPRSGAGALDTYIVEDNVFYQNRSDALLQGEGRIVIRRNWFFNAFGDAINIRPHHDVPRDIEIECNVIVARDTGIQVHRRFFDPRPRLVVTGNVVFATDPLTGIERAQRNFTGAYRLAQTMLDSVPAPLDGLNMSFRTREAGGRPLAPAGVPPCAERQQPAPVARGRFGRLSRSVEDRR